MSSEIRAAYTFEIARRLPLWSTTNAQWGKTDCALEMADIDIAVQGIDPAKDYRGRYRSERGARRVLGRAGLLGAWGRVARRHGWPRIEPKAAQDGDRAVSKTPAGISTVIRYRGRWFGRVDMGNIMVFDDKIVRAWKVC